MCSITSFSVLLLVQLISQCSHASSKPFFRNDYTFKEETQTFYKVHTRGREWQDARNRCQMEGAILFFPDDELEADIALGLWNKTEPYDWIYLGMSDLLAEGVWETVDGRPETDVYTSWRSGEPNNVYKEDCALWRRDNTMSDYLCDQKYPFICKRTLLGLETNPLCDTSDPNQPKPTYFRKDYTLLEESQAFYKVHTTRRTFQDARKRCQMEGTILFYPENDVEAEAVMGLWNRSEPYGWIYLGLTDLLIKGVWETVDGRSLLDVYHNWGHGQPDDTGGIEDCVLWRRDKTLNDYTCHEKYPFICKKSQRSLDWKTLCDVPDQNLQSKTAFFRRDYTFIKETQAFYKVHTRRRVWLDARKRCQMEGATLFYPDDAIEADIAQGLWNKTEPYDWIFLGMSDLLNEGVWETVDGRSELDVHNSWRAGEPNGYNNEDCALWRRDKTQSDYRCDEPYPFICKKDLRSLEWNTLCDMPDPSYHYSKEFGKCYKFHLTPVTWSEAHAACSAEQSYLAIINSQSEANYMAKITADAPKNETKGNFLSGTVYLGFHNRDDDGWKTVRGTSLEDSGYTGWGIQQPDGGDRETCGSMFYDGRLNDLDCSKRCFFICEHDIGLLGGAIDERWTDNAK